MKQLEIKLIDEKAIVDTIWEATDGHPNVVQRICDRLIAQLNKRGTRQITADLVYDILNTPDFQERDFLSTYWEQASELEKLITLLMVRASDMQYTRAQIVYLLEENTIAADEQAVKDALANLDMLRSILRRRQGGYSFAFKFFPQVLTNMGVDELFHIYRKMYLDEEAKR
jgi:hypothetical protein